MLPKNPHVFGPSSAPLSCCVSALRSLCGQMPPPARTSGTSYTRSELEEIEALYAQPDLSETQWPEGKIPFMESNPQYAEREARFMRFSGESADLCCLGDSITQLFEWQDAFPGLRVVNRGIGSDTTAGILARLDSVAATNPKVVSIMAGSNDTAQEGWTPEGVGENFTAILEALHTRLPDTTVIVSSMLPTSAAHPLRSEDIGAINQELKARCGELNVVYLDLFQLFADEEGNLRPEYNRDGIHLTPAGYALWLSHLAPAVAEALESKL